MGKTGEADACAFVRFLRDDDLRDFLSRELFHELGRSAFEEADLPEGIDPALAWESPSSAPHAPAAIVPATAPMAKDLRLMVEPIVDVSVPLLAASLPAFASRTAPLVSAIPVPPVRPCAGGPSARSCHEGSIVGQNLAGTTIFLRSHGR